MTKSYIKSIYKENDFNIRVNCMEWMEVKKKNMVKHNIHFPHNFVFYFKGYPVVR